MRPDRVGDVIIATACFAPLRQQYPGERLVFGAREVMRPLLEDHPLLDAFIGLPDARPALRDLPTQVRALGAQFRAQDDTRLVHLHPDAVCELAAWRAGIRSRVGYCHSIFTDWTLTHPREDHRQEGRQHEARYNLDLLAAAMPTPYVVGHAPTTGVELRPQVHLGERWRLSLEAKLSRTTAAGDLGRYLVLNPTAFSLAHRWPPENFAWLAHALAPHCDRIVLIGERNDDPAVIALRALLGGLALPHSPVDLAGGLNLAELGWLLRGAALLVSRNTGTTHLAAAVGCPVVELFGRLEPAYGPERWRSLGDRVQAVCAPRLERTRRETKRAFWTRCYTAISRDAVLAAALQELAA